MMIYLLRGLPGSGKSTWARARQQYRNTVGRGPTLICSADDWHWKPGPDGGKPEYRFDPAEAHLAHGACLKRYVSLLKADGHHNDHLVIVDNTNCSPYEIAPYYALASAYEHDVRVVQFRCTVA